MTPLLKHLMRGPLSGDHETRWVFGDLLALADDNGRIDMTEEAIAEAIRAPRKVVARAMRVLRQMRMIWGGHIFRYEFYRDLQTQDARRTYFRIKQRECRKKKAKLKRNLTRRHTVSASR